MNTGHAPASGALSRSMIDPLSQPMLRGGTLLLVEDSRLSCEAIRQMFRGSGGRLRRAESLTSARRHLSFYTPDAALIDLGLPDGSGLELIAEIDRKRPRVPLIIAISGQPELEAAAYAAGADRFLAKPFASVAYFRAQLAPVFFPFRHGDYSQEATRPDPGALRDDLYLALDLLSGERRGSSRKYALQFIATLARSLSDDTLADAVEAVRNQGKLLPLVKALHNRLRNQPLM